MGWLEGGLMGLERISFTLMKKRGREVRVGLGRREDRKIGARGERERKKERERKRERERERERMENRR